MESGTETVFVYPMVNAFPAIRGRNLLRGTNQEWKGNAVTVLSVVDT